MVALKNVRLSYVRLIVGINWLLHFEQTAVREEVLLWRWHPQSVSNSA